MQTRFGHILRQTRGKESRLSFSRRLELSYTFVRSMEEGTRFPSDSVLHEIAAKLSLDPDELLLAAYCDRSPALTDALARRGVSVVLTASATQEASNERPALTPVPMSNEVAAHPVEQPVERRIEHG